MEEILEILTRIEKNTLLASKSVFNLEDLLQYTGLSKSFIYRLTSENKIPFYKLDQGKNLFFKRDEIDAWMTKNKRKSTDEIEQESAKYCVTHKPKKK